MYHIVTNPERTRDDVAVLSELLPIVKSILKTQDSLRWLLSVDGFVYTLLLCLLLKQTNMVVDLLTFLGIICGTSEGEQQVLDAFDQLMMFNEEKTRFQSVVALLSTMDNADVVLNVLVFFNNLLHQSQSIVQRMAVLFPSRLHRRSSQICSHSTTTRSSPTSSPVSPTPKKRSRTCSTSSTSACETIGKPRCSAAWIPVMLSIWSVRAVRACKA